MNIRFTTVRRGDKVYRYPQLVESVRVDGKPRHRVLCNLSGLSDVTIDNMRVALEAGRSGQAIVIPGDCSLVGLPIIANLHFLDIAVLLRLWQEGPLPKLLTACIPGSGAEVSFADVVGALVLQRCTAPASKLKAVSWFSRSALPELMGIATGQFNNSRVHRVLDQLETVEGQLQERLPGKLVEGSGRFVTLFADVTDTWFDGQGPCMAESGLDKRGVYCRRIGVALLCDERGRPLRWKTLPGNYHDDRVLTEMAEAVSKLEWARDVPFVADRAMGRSGRVAFLASSGLRFLTAVPVDEFATCGAKVPWEPFAQVEVKGTNASVKDDCARASEAAREAGFKMIRPDRWVLDLGVFDKSVPAGSTTRPSAVQHALVTALRVCIRIEPVEQIAEETGIHTKWIQRHRVLLQLTPAIQAHIHKGEADRCTIQEILKVANLPADEQAQAFESACARRIGRARLLPRSDSPSPPPALKVRGVVHFNPERFVEQHRNSRRRIAEIEDFVQNINRQIARPGCQRTDSKILYEVQRTLRKQKLSSIFDVTIQPVADGGRRIVLTRKEEAWKIRLRYHGLNLFVAMADWNIDAAGIVDLYFAKDQVEKDFQTIKSVIELHPVRHRTDPKIRAHVSLCALALLLQRTLEERLRQAGHKMTAASAIDALATCHLNLQAEKTYSPTVPTGDQATILNALGMVDLADAKQLRRRLTPR